ncbi:MAG: hypothetical protein JW795_14960 [Chitinivibrionales bacterium]|nr:hypothetical protein [Chitinivibrionales bacterium]
MNIDGAGCGKNIRLIGKKMEKKQSQTGLTDGLAVVADALALRLRTMASVPGMGFDHVVIANRGFDAVTLSCQSLTMLLAIHSPHDRIDAISAEALDTIGKLCETYANTLDTMEAS